MSTALRSYGYGIVGVILLFTTTIVSFAPRSWTRRQPQKQQTSTTTIMAAMKGPLNQPPRPNTCTYWVSEHFLAGEHPTDKRGAQATRSKLGQYLDAGISVFIDLTEVGQKPDYATIVQDLGQERGINVEYYRMPVPDFGIPTTAGMVEILNRIDDAVSRNQKVYIHCAGGIGRTGTTVGCYLVRHGNDGTEALQEVNRLFQNSDRSMESWNSPETREQMKFVRDWKEGDDDS